MAVVEGGARRWKALRVAVRGPLGILWLTLWGLKSKAGAGVWCGVAGRNGGWDVTCLVPLFITSDSVLTYSPLPGPVSPSPPAPGGQRGAHPLATVQLLPPPRCQSLRAAHGDGRYGRCVGAGVADWGGWWSGGTWLGGPGWRLALGPARGASAESLGPLGKALVTGWEGGRWRAGRGLQPLVFSDPSCSERVESIWGPGLGAVVVAPPAEAAPDSFSEHGVGGQYSRRRLLPPRPVCRAHSGTHACIHPSVRVPWGLLCSPAQGPIFSPRLQLPRTWPSLDTISCGPEGRTIGNGGPGSGAPAWRCPIHERPGPFVPLGMGSGLGPGPGLCAGETPQETGLAKWPPFPFSSLGHECAVSLPEAAQGGRPPCRALSAPGWCPQTPRGQGWAGA